MLSAGVSVIRSMRITGSIITVAVSSAAAIYRSPERSARRAAGNAITVPIVFAPTLGNPATPPRRTSIGQ